MPNLKEIRGAFSKHNWSQSSSAETYCLQWHLYSRKKVLTTYDPWASSYKILRVRLDLLAYILHNEQTYSIVMENGIKQTHSPSHPVLCLLFNTSSLTQGPHMIGQNVIAPSLPGISYSLEQRVPSILPWGNGWKAAEYNCNIPNLCAMHVRRRFCNTGVHSWREKKQHMTRTSFNQH